MEHTWSRQAKLLEEVEEGFGKCYLFKWNTGRFYNRPQREGDAETIASPYHMKGFLGYVVYKVYEAAYKDGFEAARSALLENNKPQQ